LLHIDNLGSPKISIKISLSAGGFAKGGTPLAQGKQSNFHAKYIKIRQQLQSANYKTLIL
jgi:hypothetical protein